MGRQDRRAQICDLAPPVPKISRSAKWRDEMRGSQSASRWMCIRFTYWVIQIVVSWRCYSTNTTRRRGGESKGSGENSVKHEAAARHGAEDDGDNLE